MSMDKKYSRRFEDAVWIFLNKLEFTHMNSGGDFGIPVSDDPNVETKQIDVFAYDGKIALVIECKSAECDDDEPSKSADFKKDIIEIKSNMEYQTKAIREKFDNPDLTVGFVLFTRKYNVSDANKTTARLDGISVLNEYDLQYYNQLYKTLGPFAKNQILCDIFREKEIKSISYEVPAVRGEVSGHVAYSFLIEPSKILPLSYVAHRKVNDEEMDQTYQRMINKSKLKEIKTFIKNEGFFANNVIVNIKTDEEPLFVSDGTNVGNTQHGILHLPDKYKTLYVIDGQHRLFSFAGLKEAETTIIPVTAFYNLDLELQRKIFVDINDKQKRVDPNLLISIESRSKEKSDNVEEWVDALNTIVFSEMSDDLKSPLNHKIKDTFKKESDGDITIKSLYTAMKKVNFIGMKNKDQIFIPGPLYSSKGEDLSAATKKKAKTFFDKTFMLFRKHCPDKWDCSKNDGGYLATSNGMTALLYTIYEALSIEFENKSDLYTYSAEELAKRIERDIRLLAESFNEMDDDEIKLYKSRQGAPGQILCHKEMLVLINKKNSKFTNEKIRKYLEDSDAKYSEVVKDGIKGLEELVKDRVLETLSEIEGPWYKTKELSEIARELTLIRLEKGNDNDPLEDFIDIDCAYRIIRAGGKKYFKQFGRKSKNGTSHEERTSWITVFSDMRKKIDSNEKIMKSEAEEFLKEADAVRGTLWKADEEEDEDDRE